MSKKKLVIALQDAGAAAAIMDALPLLAEQFNLFIFAKDSMAYKKLLSKFSEAELSVWNTTSRSEMSIMEACLVLKKIQPVAVVCSLSDATKKVKSADGTLRLENKIDGAMVTAAERLGIQSIGIMEPVFMAKPLIQVRLNRSKAVPNRLIVASEIMKKALLDLGLYKKDDIIVLPMPKYAAMVKLQQNPSRKEQMQKLQKLNQIDEQATIIVYSSSAAPEQDDAALSILAEGVKDIPEVQVCFTFHPKDDDEERRRLYIAMVDGAKALDTDGMSDIEAVSCLAVGSQGLLTGVKSSLLFDGLVAGCNVASINPNQDINYRSATAQLGLAAEMVMPSSIKRMITNLKAGRFRKGNELSPMLKDAEADKHFAEALAELIR